jgi:hypothetical protein
MLLLGSHGHAMAQPNLEGVWAIDPTLFREYSDAKYTPEGQRRHDSFDGAADPSYKCIPSGLGRAWDEPDTSAKIEQFDDLVVISYEMYDLVRTIGLNQNGHPLEPRPSTSNLSGVSMPTMGHSIGWYEDDVLVIESLAYAPGNITTLRRRPPQSVALRSIERIHRDAEDRLVVEITYVDSIILSEPMTAKNRYLRSAFKFSIYDCEPSNQEED